MDNDTPTSSAAGPDVAALPTWVSDVYCAAPAPLRVKLLECLLRPVGPLALAVIASGAFGAFLQRRTWAGAHLSVDDIGAISGEQLFELAGYLEQASPEVFLQMPAVLAGSPLAVATGSGALLLAALLQRHSGRLPPAGGMRP
jgi:hypothetical protein